MCLGIPGKIVAFADSSGDAQPESAIVDVAGVKRQVNIACVIDNNAPRGALIGQWVLVHVGFAMSRIDPKEAAATLALMAQLGELQNELDDYEHSLTHHREEINHE